MPTLEQIDLHIIASARGQWPVGSAASCPATASKTPRIERAPADLALPHRADGSHVAVHGDGVGQSRICPGLTADEGFQGIPPASMDQGIAQMTARGGPGPGFSVQYATLEVLRVAAQRGPRKDAVRSVVYEATTDRTSEVLGEPAVDVVTVHAALAGRQ